MLILFIFETKGNVHTDFLKLFQKDIRSREGRLNLELPYLRDEKLFCPSLFI